MKAHTKIYLNHFGLTIADFVCCEVCGAKAIDLHHIKSRGMGGSNTKNNIENIMALCRECHLKFGDRKEYTEFLTEKHNEKLKPSILLCSGDEEVILVEEKKY